MSELFVPFNGPDKVVRGPASRAPVLQGHTSAVMLLGSVMALVLLAGCVSTQSVQQIDRLESVKDKPRILLMTPDIKYYMVTASGIPETNADWTSAARRNFATAVQNYADARGTDLVMITDADQLGPAEVQYSKLHSAVGATIQTHYFGGDFWKLPSKGDQFDWSLGPGISVIGDRYEADYALFSFYRDYEATRGRTLSTLFGMNLMGYTPANKEEGFASLVDLKTGDIVWFNVLFAGAGGSELRKEDGAAKVVNDLFKDMPAR